MRDVTAVVVSNKLNFMAARVLRQISGVRRLVVHVDKTNAQVENFPRDAWDDQVVFDGKYKHGDVIDMLLQRRVGDDLLLFVDHDVVFADGVFESQSGAILSAIHDRETTYIAAQRHEPRPNMVCPYVFRTTPMFAVRQSASCDIKWREDVLHDTGQLIALRRPDLVALVDEFAPYNAYHASDEVMLISDGMPMTHWTSHWMFARGDRLARWMDKVEVLMREYGEVDGSDLDRMREIPSFRKFMSHKFERI